MRAIAIKRRILLVLVLALGVLRVGAETVSPFTLPSARLGALGGRHGTLTDDFTTLFTNPAGFVGVKEQFSAAQISASAYGPLFDIADVLVNYLGSSGALDISKIVGPGGLATGLSLGGPVSFGWVGRGLGFGIFNRTTMDAVTLGSTLKAVPAEELLITGGYAFRVFDKNNQVIDAGFLGKGFFRGTLGLQSSIFTVTDLFSGDPLGSRPFTTVAGVGVDLGVKYDLAKTFDAALVWHDAYSPALKSTYASTADFISGKQPISTPSYVIVSSGLDLGVSYTPKAPQLDQYVSRLSFYLDYRDMLNLFALIPRNPILNVGLGIEAVVLDALSLRAGITDALPALGFGIDFTFMRLDFAMRGVELGLDPGVQPTYAIDLDLLFRY